MNYCKNCKCKLSETTLNCPLCGARTYKDPQQKDDTLYCDYLKNPYTPLSAMVKNIFIGLFAIAFLILAVVCAVFIKKFDVLLYYAVGVAFVWLAIFRHIFKAHRTKTILNSNTIYMLLLSLFILLLVKRIDIFVAYFLPIILNVLLIVELFIVVIGNKFKQYCLSILLITILAIPLFLVNYFLNYITLPSIIFISIACVTLVFSIVLGKSTIGMELSKRLHM